MVEKAAGSPSSNSNSQPRHNEKKYQKYLEVIRPAKYLCENRPRLFRRTSGFSRALFGSLRDKLGLICSGLDSGF